LAELRAAVVFTVQDVLADPPFPCPDFMSESSVLFAPRRTGDGCQSETVGSVEVISKSERLYQIIGRSRSGELRFSMSAADDVSSEVCL
jgi:two-component system, chemotaxis family, CheB/CheR fusion protein